jgi:hypothetical protein
MNLKIARAPNSLTQTAAELTHHFTARQLPNLLLRQRHRFRTAVAEGAGASDLSDPGIHDAPLAWAPVWAMEPRVPERILKHSTVIAASFP